MLRWTNKLNLVCLPLLACLSLQAEESRLSERVFAGSDRLAAVANATEVEVCILRVRDPSHGQNLNRRKFVEGTFQKLPPAAAALAIQKLIDERNYTWDAVPACIPTYNARLRFICGKRIVDVDFCFSCQVFLVHEAGLPLGGAYFTEGSDWIFQIVAEQFPRDPAVKKLWKERAARRQIRLQIEMAIALEQRKKAAKEQESR